MAVRFVQDASGALAPTYDQAQANIQGQIPAAQQLYDTLIQGLQGQVQQGTQAVTNSAARRGVLSAALPGQVGSTLGQDAALAGAQLGAQRAGDIAAITGNLTNLGAGRVQNSTEIAGTMNQEDLQRQQAALEQQQNQRKFEMDIQSAEREAQLADIQARNAAGRSRASAPAVSKETTTKIKGVLDSVRGKDGKVSPADYTQALAVWAAQGGDASSFHSSFKGYVNLEHPDDYYRPERLQEAQQLVALIKSGVGAGASAISKKLRK